MSVKLKVNVEQLADALVQLTPTEVDKLEQLVDQRTSGEILKRSKQALRGKYISVKKTKSFKNIDCCIS